MPRLTFDIYNEANSRQGRNSCGLKSTHQFTVGITFSRSTGYTVTTGVDVATVPEIPDCISANDLIKCRW